MKIQELKDFATKQNIRTEQHDSEKGEFRKYIGIESNNIWHWFYFFEGIDDLYFDHSYNRNTGATKKGFKYGWNVYLRYTRAIIKNA